MARDEDAPPYAVARLDRHRTSRAVTACNFARHPKGLRWRTAFQASCDAWARDATPFELDPHHLVPAPKS